jgi:dihydropteroate synthase
MGILNVTPDSFSGDGLSTDVAAARVQAQRFVEEGAALLDVGGESTRPGAASVPVDEEIRRVVPVIEAIVDLGVPVSIDTSKPDVMREALAAGACLINDINALLAPGALQVAAASRAGVCLMHKQGTPQTMQQAPAYGDVLAEVTEYLARRAQAAQDAGIEAPRILLDPGFGFGKTLAHNLALLNGLDRIVGLGYPVLAGLSRKSMLGAITGRAADDRLAGSLAAALFAVSRGARIIRCHDVAATQDALRVWQAISQAGLDTDSPQHS